MIRIVGKGDKLTAEEVLGRYVLKEAGIIYASLSSPRIVVRVSGSRAYLDRENGVWDAAAKVRLLTGDGEREPDGHIALSSIRCICDTPQEVNAVLKSVSDGHAAYAEFLAGEVRRIETLHGK